MTEKRPTPPPFSLRLTFEERAQLEYAAGDMALGAYVRAELFRDGKPKKRYIRGKRPVKDQKELAELTALLGRSHISNNLNQLAHAVNVGSLVLTPEIEQELRQACHDIRLMRMLLMRALGIYAEPEPDDGALP